MKTILAVLLSAAPAFARAAAPAALMPSTPELVDKPLPGDLLQATIHRLPNGLTVYLSPNHEVPRIAARIAVRTGSKNDPAETTGLAHYLEHMLFKGTSSLGTLDWAKEGPHIEKIFALYDMHFAAKDPEKRAEIYKEIDRESLAASKFEAPNEIAKIYRRIGARGLNAFTSDEQTVYVVDLPSNRAETWAKLESERFAHPVFRLFQSELEAVYEEKNRTLDNDERLLGEALNKALYPEHPYGTQTTIGTIEHLKNPSLSRMLAYFHRYYVPNNMTIALSGDFDPDAMMALIDKYFGAWRPAPLPPGRKWPLPAPKGVQRVEVRYESEEKVVVAWPTVAALDSDADAITVMDMLMDNSAAGIINLTLNQAQKVKAAGSSPTFYNDAGDWEMYAVPKRGQTLEQAEALLMDCVAKLKKGEFTDDDIKAVITSFEIGEKLRLESNDASVGTMVDSFIKQEPWSHEVGQLDRLRRVTKKDVLRAADKYLGPDRVVAYRRLGKPEIPSIQKPGFTKLSLDNDRQSTLAAEILALPAKPIEPRWLVPGRDYVEEAIPQGKIYAVKNPFDDLFSLTFELERGSRQERDLCAALGLAELSGAGEMTAEDLRKKLFSLGSSIGYSCGEQSSEVSLSGLDSHLEETLSLMRERFAKPNIAPETLMKMVDVTIGAHQDAKKDPEAVMGALGEFARRGQESSVLNELTDKELQALDEAKLKSLLNGFLGYRARVTYVGNRPIAEIEKLISAKGPFAEPPPRQPVRFLAPAKTKVYFTHRDMVQAQVGVFAADGVFDPERAVDYSMFSSYLGGGMSSLLFQEVRESKSLAYAVWGGYAPAGHKGDDNEVYAQLGCQADKTPEAAELLAGLANRPPMSERRFDETRKAVEENYRTNPIPFRFIPSQLIGWEDQGLQEDPRPKRFERLLSYTLDDLKAFSSHLASRPQTVYVLGDRARVGLDAIKKSGDFEERGLDQLFPY